MKTTKIKGLLLLMLMLVIMLATGNVLSYSEDMSAETDIYLIGLADAPLATYRGGISGLEATNPSARGEAKLNIDSAASVAYIDYLAGQRAALLAEMERRFGRSIDVEFEYYATNNGLAVHISVSEAEIVATLPGVTVVRQDYERRLMTDNGPNWINAPDVWDGVATGGAPGTRGEGIIVGIIDTGINPSNPSFADIGGDGYDHTNPWGPGTYVGVCDSADPSFDPTFPCNDKLIGAWGYPTVNGGDPRDYDGHGSHTASTTAGNVVSATVVGPTLSITRTISGVAPHANIVAYSACCTASALTAAINQIVLDGVDAVNYSIGSDTPGNPWDPADFDTAGFLAARDAGIFVATSAGNAGPGAATVGSPAVAPWIMSVGASTHDRSYPNSLASMTGGVSPPADILGKGFTAGYGPAPIVYAGDYSSGLTATPELCGAGAPGSNTSPWPPGTFSGEIVVCDRGTFGRVEKGINVLAAGAGGYVLANTAVEGESLVGDAHSLPGIHIGMIYGDMVRTWLATGTGHMATISGATLSESPANGDIMAGFSSRGPNVPAPAVIVPSIAAPGVDIIAADGVGDAISWGFNSGTSMASPHMAGAGALMMAVHPDWSPAELQSALMMTANNTAMLKDDGMTPADPFDHGSGRVDLSGAAEAGFVLDESMANYLAADPSMGGDPSTLNLASVANNQCLGSCSWTRVVSSTLGVTANYSTTYSAAAGMVITVDPATFSLAAGASQTITITADVTGVGTSTDWSFGQINFIETGALSPDLHFPLAVIPSNGVLPAQIDINTGEVAGSVVLEDLLAIEISALTVDYVGLAEGNKVETTLMVDPTNGDPYDNLNDGTTLFITVTVPVDTMRFVAEVVRSEATDIDLFIGRDMNGDMTPQENEEVCRSTTATAIEYCNENEPDSGIWWILIQNWADSAPGADDFVRMFYAAVGNSDAGNLLASPTGQSVPINTPFDLSLAWDEPDLGPAEEFWYGAITLYPDASKSVVIGTMPIDLQYTPHLYLPFISRP